MKKKSHRFSRRNILLQKIRATIFPLVLRLAAPVVFVRRRLWPHKVSFCKISGISTGGQPPFTILCGVTGQNKSFFMRLAFDNAAHESDLGQVPLREVFRANRDLEKDCSLVVVETNQSHYAWLNTGNWFFIPIWAIGKIELPVAEKFLKSSSVKRDLRAVRQRGYEYEIVPGEEAFKDFYHNMHVPQISKNYGDEGMLDSYAEKRSRWEECDLLLVKKKNQPDRHIAGMLILYDPAEPRLWSLGVRKGHFQNGLMPALYHFSFQHLMAKGFLRVNTGASRAFLRDGVLKFKRKMSQTITDFTWKGLALKIISFTPATKNFLQNNPFIFQAGGAWHGAVFVDSTPSSENLRQIFKSDFHPGLAKLVVYSFAEDASAGPDPIPPELAGQIEIRSAGELLSARPHLP
jgi:hypothetical protein